jgi:hypothetical protein
MVFIGFVRLFVLLNAAACIRWVSVRIRWAPALVRGGGSPAGEAPGCAP